MYTRQPGYIKSHSVSVTLWLFYAPEILCQYQPAEIYMFRRVFLYTLFKPEKSSKSITDKDWDDDLEIQNVRHLCTKRSNLLILFIEYSFTLAQRQQRRLNDSTNPEATDFNGGPYSPYEKTHCIPPTGQHGRLTRPPIKKAWHTIKCTPDSFSTILKSQNYPRNCL